jgi:hypothetical protein
MDFCGYTINLGSLMHFEEWQTKEHRYEGKHVPPQCRSNKYISIVGDLSEK